MRSEENPGGVQRGNCLRVQVHVDGKIWIATECNICDRVMENCILCWKALADAKSRQDTPPDKPIRHALRVLSMSAYVRLRGSEEE